MSTAAGQDVDEEQHVSSGGVVFRCGPEGELQVFLLHRYGPNTWHLPKGMQSGDETLEETALREIREETGARVLIGRHVGAWKSTFKRAGRTVDKLTHYFVTTFDRFVQGRDREHDTGMFLPVPEALELLRERSPYEPEWQVLEAAVEALEKEVP